MLFLEKFCNHYRGQLEFYCERDSEEFRQGCFVISENKINYRKYYQRNTTRQYCIGI